MGPRSGEGEMVMGIPELMFEIETLDTSTPEVAAEIAAEQWSQMPSSSSSCPAATSTDRSSNFVPEHQQHDRLQEHQHYGIPPPSFLQIPLSPSAFPCVPPGPLQWSPEIIQVSYALMPFSSAVQVTGTTQ